MVTCHGPARLGQEQGEQERPLTAAQRHGTTVAPDGERAEYVELDSAHGLATLHGRQSFVSGA
jgi:hypothetical protein